MHLDWWTFALQTINFLILVWLLQRFLYRPVLAVIGRRRDEIERVMADANRTKSAAEEQRRLLEEAGAKAVAERDRLMLEARQQAEEEKERTLAATRADADKIIAESHARLETEREAAAEQLENQAARLGVAVAQRLLAQTPPPNPLHPFLERVAAAIAGMPPEERAQLSRQTASDGVTLACSVELTPDLARECVERLSPLLGTDAALHFVVDPSLIAGIELRLPNLVIGDSWRDSLAGAKAALMGNERSDAVR